MSLILIGTNHGHSDLRTRERLSFSRDDIALALSAIAEEKIAKGAVILSTCHRVEIYADAEGVEPLRKFFLEFKECPELGKHLYIKEEAGAVHHLFKVASGLDSQVLGEREILHQVKEAYFTAKRLGRTTSLLNKTFERALFTGRIVRKTTRIADADPSIASLAVRTAYSMTDFNKKKIFIIGAGEVASRVAALCAAKGARCVIIANRTFEKAKILAERIKGRAIRFEEFYALLNEADIIFSATGSRHLILKKEKFAENRSAEKGLVIFDLAFPRDIDPAIGMAGNVTLFNLDDFKEARATKDRHLRLAAELTRQKAERFLEKEEAVWK